jgi:hypothetical protein
MPNPGYESTNNERITTPAERRGDCCLKRELRVVDVFARYLLRLFGRLTRTLTSSGLHAGRQPIFSGAPVNTRVVPLTRDARTANGAISTFLAAKDPGFDLDVHLPKLAVMV